MKIKTPPAASSRRSGPLRQRHAGAQQHRNKKKSAPPPTSPESALERGENAADVEKTGSADDAHQKPPRSSQNPMPMGEDIELYFLLKETVNYFSIDHTDRGR